MVTQTEGGNQAHQAKRPMGDVLGRVETERPYYVCPAAIAGAVHLKTTGRPTAILTTRDPVATSEMLGCCVAYPFVLGPSPQSFVGTDESVARLLWSRSRLMTETPGCTRPSVIGSPNSVRTGTTPAQTGSL